MANEPDKQLVFHMNEFLNNESLSAHKRRKNFAPKELNIIISMVEENADLIYNRVNRNPKYHSKQDFWLKVTQLINESCHFAAKRDIKEVRRKWVTYQSEVKSKNKDGCQLLNDHEKRVLELIQENNQLSDIVFGGGVLQPPAEQTAKNMLTMLPSSSIRPSTELVVRLQTAVLSQNTGPSSSPSFPTPATTSGSLNSSLNNSLNNSLNSSINNSLNRSTCSPPPSFTAAMQTDMQTAIQTAAMQTGMQSGMQTGGINPAALRALTNSDPIALRALTNSVSPASALRALTNSDPTALRALTNSDPTALRALTNSDPNALRALTNSVSPASAIKPERVSASETEYLMNICSQVIGELSPSLGDLHRSGGAALGELHRSGGALGELQRSASVSASRNTGICPQVMGDTSLGDLPAQAGALQNIISKPVQDIIAKPTAQLTTTQRSRSPITTAPVVSTPAATQAVTPVLTPTATYSVTPTRNIVSVQPVNHVQTPPKRPRTEGPSPTQRTSLPTQRLAPNSTSDSRTGRHGEHVCCQGNSGDPGLALLVQQLVEQQREANRLAEQRLRIETQRRDIEKEKLEVERARYELEKERLCQEIISRKK